MGSRGPNPTPTKLKVLRGNPRHRPLPKDPEPAAVLPVQPADMSDDAKAVWDRIMRDYAATGVLTAVDTDTFRVYCEAVARYLQVAPLLERSGPLVKGARGHGELVRNPLHQVVRDNADLIRVMGRELGFTPASRAGIGTNRKVADDDPLAQWAQAK